MRCKMVVLLAFTVGCSFVPVDLTKTQVNSNQVNVASGTDSELEDTLLQLTSSDFLEYTQAAQHLIQKGPSIIPQLINNQHLLRASNDTVIPVSLLIVEIIFTQQTKAWVISQLTNPNVQIRKIAVVEVERRAQENK